MIDVLVVGGGPTGLFLARELHRHGLTCRIIEKSKKRAMESRALVLQPRTLEIFSHVGILKPFLEKGFKIHEAHLKSKKHPVGTVHFSYITSPYPFLLSLEQYHTEEILESFLPLPLEREVELLSFRQHKDHISSTVLLEDGGEKEIESRWIVGADGAHSIVRKTLHIPFDGEAFPDIFSIADIEMESNIDHNVFTSYVDGKGPLALIPLPSSRAFRLIFQLDRCLELLKSDHSLSHGPLPTDIVPAPAEEEIKELLELRTGEKIKIKRSLWLVNFRISTRQSKKYKVKNAFLAGDAAHIHSPVGAQGMNTGLQDVYNLAWKLAYAKKELCPKTLLQTYQNERHEVGKKLLRTTKFVSESAFSRSLIIAKIRNFLFAVFSRFPFVQRMLTENIAEVNIKYKKSPFIQGFGVFSGKNLLGKRAPDVKLGSHRKSLYNTMQNTTSFHLLVFHPKKALVDELKEAIAEMPIEIHFVGEKNSIAYQTYGVKGSAIYLIRPDNVICFKENISESVTHFYPFIKEIFQT